MSGGQHVGRLSDSLTDTDEREVQHAALKRLMKPTNRGGGIKYDIANGDPCPSKDADGNSLGHGKMFVLQPSGTQWCAHSDHTSKKEVPRG